MGVGQAIYSQLLALIVGSDELTPHTPDHK